MVYVKRRDTFHVDSSPDLYGENILCIVILLPSLQTNSPLSDLHPE